MSKIIIHIGLPKTATTSLQISFFPKLNDQRIFYVGVHHPRKENNNYLYRLFYAYMENGKNLNEIRNVINEELKSGFDLLIS